MDRLPEEVLLQILSFLAIPDLITLQSVSTRYLTLARDNALWKTECFDHSRAESSRRRQQLLPTQDPRLAQLRNAVSALPGGDLTARDVSQLRGTGQLQASRDPVAEARMQRMRALANWEPGYPGERMDYYEEFIHRHARINVDWLSLPKSHTSDKEELREATGIGTLNNDSTGEVDHLVAPLDDGSICIWDLSSRSTSSHGGGGKLLVQSRSGLLTGQAVHNTTLSRAAMTETGAVECVSIDSGQQKGYFAHQNVLQEVDLRTLQVTSTTHYPWPITALSEASVHTPLTVGTNWTIHLHDLRDSTSPSRAETGELIAGPTPTPHALLSQPGPLSILHTTHSLWVAGRFTSLLHYDRRFFPRLHSTLHSGARIASLTLLPYPHLPQTLNLLRNPCASLPAFTAARSASPSVTLLAAAEYKGKGSLELFGLPHTHPPYQNRQTASASKLLSVAAHGGRIIFSDGDGNVKWVERDGFSHVRTFNINDALSPSSPGGGGHGAHDARAQGIWSSSAAEMPGQGDIVRKLLPTHPISASSSSSTNTTTTSTAASPSGRADTNTSNLLLWTGDGRLGVLGFGPSRPLGPSAQNSLSDENETAVESASQRARGDAERQFGMAMRRALERSADEVRFVRGLGMGYQ